MTTGVLDSSASQNSVVVRYAVLKLKSARLHHRHVVARGACRWAAVVEESFVIEHASREVRLAAPGAGARAVLGLFSAGARGQAPDDVPPRRSMMAFKN
jgi:hypothetical protein